MASFRLDHERSRDQEPPLHTPTVAVDPVLEAVTEAAYRLPSLDHLLDITLLVSVETHHESQVLLPVQVLVRTSILREVAEYPTYLISFLDYIVSEDLSHTRSWAYQGPENSERGGFSSAVRSNEAEDLVFLDLEGYSLQSFEVTEALPEIAYVYGESHKFLLVP